MLVPNQKIKVRMSGKTIKHYRELGYDVKDVQTELLVPVEHLTKGSHAKIELICDYCGKSFERVYKAYLRYHSEDGKDYCDHCGKSVKTKKTIKKKYNANNVMEIPGVKEKIQQTCLERYGTDWYSKTEEFKEKTEKTCLEKYGVKTFLYSPEVREQINKTVKEKYGVDNIAQLESVKEKSKETCLKKYGVEYTSQSDDFKEKFKETCIKKYGGTNPMTSLEIKEKFRLTNLERYGVDNPFKSDEIKEKIKQTCIEKYGVEYFPQTDLFKEKVKETCMRKYGVESIANVPEVREKINNTLLKNNSVKTSKQQNYIYDLLKNKYDNVEKNYCCDNSFFDVAVFVNDIKIDIEYDGWYWHQDKQRDRRRDEHFKAKGWKILRIRSGHMFPTEEQLFSAINELLSTDRIFKEIYLEDWKNYKDDIQTNIDLIDLKQITYEMLLDYSINQNEKGSGVA